LKGNFSPMSLKRLFLRQSVVLPRATPNLEWRILIFVFLLTVSLSFAVSTFQTTNLTLKYHDPRDQPQLEFVFNVWTQAQAKLRRIGLEPRAITLEAYASARQFTKATGEPWFVAAVTQGTLIQTQRLGALKFRGILRFTILHEAFHTVQPAKLPRWLAEGLARIFSGEDQSDPKQTKLEALSQTALNSALEGRNAQIKLNEAYWEASRRARGLLTARGWKGLLAFYR
jgi:hypothetical protein